MRHKPIQITGLNLSFPHKTCFENFNAQILAGNRIGIIGRNGCGKSSLLKMIERRVENIKIPEKLIIAYVPQIIEDFTSFSGGERFNKALTKAIQKHPDILLLDEPTNHLDQHQRKGLLNYLHQFSGAVLIATHDQDILEKEIDILWHIDQEKIHIFSGNYQDYWRALHQQRKALEDQLSHLHGEKKAIHDILMKEQSRAAKSKARGIKKIAQRKWPTIVSNAKVSRANKFSGEKKSTLRYKKNILINQLSHCKLPKIIAPKFSLPSQKSSVQELVSISEGTIGYQYQSPLLTAVHFSIKAENRIVIQGRNGSGKSMFVKAILNDSRIIKTGQWQVYAKEIGYLDQQYSTLDLKQTVYSSIATLVPAWKTTEIRRHLCDFLFRSNEEIQCNVKDLSGGEKARLSLAKIATKTPSVLILDEITNNLDIQTKEHIIQILKNYPGALIVISHDDHFISEIGVTDIYQIENGTLIKQHQCN